MRRNLFLQIATMILLVSISSCDWDIFGSGKKAINPGKMVDRAKDKAGAMANDVASTFDPNNPKYEGMTEEQIRAKELETGLFDEVMGMQDAAMEKLSDLKKMKTNLAVHKGASNGGGSSNGDDGSAMGGKESGMMSSASPVSTSNKSGYNCVFAEEERMAARKNAASTSEGGSNTEVVATIDKLTKAEDSLYKFMNNFDQPKDLSHDEAINYFESEKEKMTTIKDDVFESIEQGEALLETLE